MNTVAVSLSQPIGSTNIGVIPKNFLNNEIQSASEAFVAEKDLGEAVEKYEKKKGEKMRRRNGKFMGGNNKEDGRSDSLTDIQSRRDTLTDINLGMSLLASTIKVVSAVLTILGADDTTRYVVQKSSREVNVEMRRSRGHWSSSRIPASSFFPSTSVPRLKKLLKSSCHIKVWGKIKQHVQS